MEKVKNGKTKKIIVGVVLFLVAVSFVGVCFFFGMKKNFSKTVKANMENVSQKVEKYLSSKYDDLDVEESKKDEDYKYSYSKASYYYVKDIGKKYNSDFAVAIYMFDSNVEAEAKIDFYNKIDEAVHSKYDNTAFELSDNYDSIFLADNYLFFTKGKFLFAISKGFEDPEKIEKKIKSLLEDFKFDNGDDKDKEEIKKYWEEEGLNKELERIESVYQSELVEIKKEFLDDINYLDTCEGKKCDDFYTREKKKEKYPELSEEIAALEAKHAEVNRKRDETVNSINASIASVKKTLNEDEYNNVVKVVGDLSDPYYDSFKEGWNNELNSINESVYKKNCASYSYKDILRNPDNYEGKKAYFFGKIVQKVSSTEYRVGIDCKRYSYSDGYYCDNTIYVVYSGPQNLIEDDMVEFWGVMRGTITYTTVLNSSLTIPKFSAKYATLK